ARAAEDALFQGLARNVTNLFARTVDRAMSRAISRRLAPHPVTPNQITIFSTLLGILGALVMLDPSYLAGAVGAFLFFAHTVIDGCDGEIARLKFQESAWGAKLDLIGDNVVHAFLFPCMAARFYFADPSGPFLALGAVALTGVLVTWGVVYALIVRRDPSPTVRRCFETFANREFAYLVLALGLLGKLDWFVWAMAFGLWIFPSALVVGWAWDRRAA
ncbi:MAG: CDP-alcohol phosphatidyltransferase family protein, partial [Candidatus Binatia bacterium]